MEYDKLMMQGDYFHTTTMMHHSIVIRFNSVLPPLLQKFQLCLRQKGTWNALRWIKNLDTFSCSDVPTDFQMKRFTLSNEKNDCQPHTMYDDSFQQFSLISYMNKISPYYSARLKYSEEHQHESSKIINVNWRRETELKWDNTLVIRNLIL